MADKKQPKETKEVPKSEKTENLKKNLQEISFKNSQIKQLMAENASLRSKLGNRGRNANRRTSSAGSALPSLQRLGSAPEMPQGYRKSSK